MKFGGIRPLSWKLTRGGCQVIHSLQIRLTRSSSLSPSKSPIRFYIPRKSSQPPIHHALWQKRVPQGSPPSGILFMVAFNGIFLTINFPVKPIFFASDLTIHLATSDPQRASRILQKTIDSILAWANKNGFRFSHSKTLLLNSFPIPQVDSVRCLGLRFHSRYSWLPHL